MTFNSLLENLLGRREQKAAPILPEEPKLPFLDGRADELYEVYFIDNDKPKIDRGIIKDMSPSTFYLGSKSPHHFYLLFIDHLNPNGKRSAVYMVKRGDETVYRNDDVPFDLEQAEVFY